MPEDGGNPTPYFSGISRRGIRWPHSLRSLRHRNYRLFFFGQLISLIGSWIQTITQNWLVYRLSGSELQLGLLNFVALLPLLPLTLWSGGAIGPDVQAEAADHRFNADDAAGAGAGPAGPISRLSGYGTSCASRLYSGGCTRSRCPPGKSFVAELVPKSYLSNAIALNSVVFNSARIIGPSIAGIIIAMTGEAPAFFLNTVSYIAVIIALAAMKFSRVEKKRTQRSISSFLKEGIRYTAKHRTAWIMISLVGVSALFTMPFMVILPSVVNYFPGKGGGRLRADDVDCGARRACGGGVGGLPQE